MNPSEGLWPGCSSEAAAISSGILKRYRAVVRASRERPPALRFGRRTVAVSTIAQQFYCEKAVQFRFERPLPPTQYMRDGTAGHDTVAALGVPMTHEEAVLQAATEREAPLCVYEFRIGWEHGGIVITGLVDEAWFRSGEVELVAERKFSGSPGIYRSYRVQAALYCLGLGEMGFGTEGALYRVSVFRRECHACESLASGTCPVLTGSLPQDIACGRAGVSEVFPFEREETLRDLEWALQFWRCEREAEPTTIQGRCRACRYRSMCNSAVPRQES